MLFEIWYNSHHIEGIAAQMHLRRPAAGLCPTLLPDSAEYPKQEEKNLIGIILFVLVVFSLLRGFMLYPKTKDSFGMGKAYSSTTSTICGLLYIVILIGLLAESWVEISVVCLIATFVLQLRPLIRAGNVQAMARVMGGGYLP
ncbi:MAG: hypothetical protein LUD83_08155 [Clostridiales bacterium]|nr:hypothetical protein [Clostridiales bacterium]